MTSYLPTVRRLPLITLTLFVIASFALPLSAATYYVDFASGSDTNNGTSKATPWKRVKGMTGCTGTCATTTLTAGDTVIFKGGVAWTGSYPWTFSSGSSSAMVTYTTDKTWYTGSSFSQPVFNDQGANPGAIGMANLSNGGYVTLNDLKFINCGTAGVSNSDKCIVFTNSHDITITNSTFATQAWISIYVVFTTGGAYSNFTFTENDFSGTSGAVWMATAATSASVRSFTYTGNTFHDFMTQIGDDVHGDGALHWFTVPAGDSTQYLDGLKFCNNRFYGDFRRSFGATGAMTGFIFLEGNASGVICNNDMSFSPAQGSMFDGLIVLEGENSSRATSIEIYNNSMVQSGTNAMSAAIHISSNYKNVAIKNNIISGMQYGIYAEEAGNGFVSNYNLLSPTSGQNIYGGSFQSASAWQAGGRDVNGIMGSNPLFVAAPSDQRLQSGSPARGKGTNLSGLGYPLLNSDRAGTARPSSGVWDMGAYQYGVATAPVPPVPPTLVSTKVQ